MSKKMDEQEKYIEIMKKIDTCYAKIINIRPLSEGEIKYFINEFSISSSHNSNAIEGNTFTLDETKLLIEKGIITGAHSLRESEDIIGYKQAFDYLYNSLKIKEPITEEFVKKIQSFVLRGDEESGRYRTIQNYIGNMFKIYYTPCSAKEVPSKMKEYIERLQEDFKLNTNLVLSGNISWVKLFHNLAKHHIEFENIHPFIDGNGRTGRLLLIYELISLGLLPIDVRYEERDKYFAAIKSYRDKEKYSIREESKTEKLAKLFAECELESMLAWLRVFSEEEALIE